MDNKIEVTLCNYVIHIDIGKRRNTDDEDVYEKKLRIFAKDRLYNSIMVALNCHDYIMAEQFSNRLRIKSYNLGMVRLAKQCAELCLAIQSGKGAPLFAEEVNDVTSVYGTMQDCIERALM